MIKNFKKYEKEQKNKDPGPLQPQEFSERLINELQLKMEEVEENTKALTQIQSRRKISYKKSILSAIESFKDYKLDSVDQYKELVPQKPLQHPFASQYIEAIKINNFDEVQLLLNTYRTLVYEFDNQFQTGLHWASKRGHSKIIQILIRYKANINIKDVLGRTPLWTACKYNRIDAVRILLANRANAFIK